MLEERNKLVGSLPLSETILIMIHVREQEKARFQTIIAGRA